MKIILLANTDWYLFNYRLPLAKALQEQGHTVILLTPPGDYTTRLQQQGFHWQAFPLERKSANPLKELAAIARLYGIFRREQPDIVHNFTIKPVLYGSLAARLAGVPQVINAVTGLGFAFAKQQSLLRAVVSLLYRISLGSAMTIFQNPEDLNEFVRLELVKAEQTRLIPSSGVDMQVFRPSPEPEGEPVAVFAGRFLRSKGVPAFIEAAHALRGEGLAARFALVGAPYPDNPESITAQEVSDWQKENIVEYWGWRDDMAALLPQAAIVCLPTTYKEGLPRILVEAGACGRPVIATDIPGCRLAVRPGENGFLIPPGDVHALTEALRTLLTSRALREKMGARGRELAAQYFSVESVVEETLKLYARKA